MRLSIAITILTGLTFLSGCSDPSANKSKAVTGEAAPVASPPAGAQGQKYLITPQNSKLEAIPQPNQLIGRNLELFCHSRQEQIPNQVGVYRSDKMLHLGTRDKDHAVLDKAICFETLLTCCKLL